jgi:putative colanic acid biosynthesis acetyltransferase WcaF
LLRLFGAKVGLNVRIDPSAMIFAPWYFEIGADSSVGYDVLVYNLGSIQIGERVTISQSAHLCAGTHDYTDPRMPLRKTPIKVMDEAWVCADAFVGPNVCIGRRAVVGARAVVVRDVAEDTVVAGNPAVRVKTRVIIQ